MKQGELGKMGRRTSLACSRVNLGLRRGAGATTGAGAGTGAGPEVSGSVRMVTWELSTAEVSNTEGVYGEAERWRVMVVLVVDVEEGGDLEERVSTVPSTRRGRE